MTGSNAIELQLAALRGRCDGRIRTDHGERDLVDHLWDHRVHLARHDRRAGLARGQRDLAEAGLRTAREQAQIVADLGELDRGALEGAGDGHEDAGVARGLDEVGRGLHLDPGHGDEVASHGLRIPADRQ